MAILRFALLALVVAAAAACYKPNIMNGGLGCSDAGTCPEGFVCSPIDNHCYKPDAGPSCPANMAHVTPLCSDPPASGSVCNPACQTGCACGRCTVVGTVTACTVVGPKTEGSLCNPAADDCASGLGCVRELCGTNVARCRKFCRLKPDCSGHEFCSDIFGPAYVCQAPAVPTCNPLDGSGCPDPVLTCYVNGPDTICSCTGTGQEGADCTSTGRCAPGFTCLTTMAGTNCFKVCDSNSPQCTATNPACHPQFGASLQFGFCGQP